MANNTSNVITMKREHAAANRTLRVVVVGGGLAGMAAAVALESRGVAVTLLEARRALGGRASSFEDGETGELLDNCQHVLLGCCTNLLDLYRRMGAGDSIRFERVVQFLDECGVRHSLAGTGRLPAPVHLAPAMLGFGALSLRHRFAINRAMLAMLRLGKSGREQLENVAFGEWLREHKQPQRVVQRFYDPVLVGALNEQTNDASAKYAIQVFQDAMLFNRNGYIVGLPACPLEELYKHIPCKDVRCATRVAEIIFNSGLVQGVKLTDGSMIAADAVVLAANHHAVQRWVSDEIKARDHRFAGLAALESVPILGVHLWFDRPVMKLSHAALLEGPLQWLFRKDAIGSMLHGVISASRDWVDVPKPVAMERFERQVRGLFPVARDAKLLRGVIVIEKRATFSPKPGADALRPQQGPPAGGVANMFLAGDYTRTGWPATMEGAVRSGYLAAEALCRKFNLAVDERIVQSDLPVEWPARLLARRRSNNFH
ncbi:MAG: FAD-dependent oxidoreductase [Phycisphaerales bacterium]|nr:FAD-dependent oxidoreductase [Phycisphaerales bacterium]